ncbi:DUF222 domain-containing protein [Nocardia uniformis]|uniref:DUF222 domain-containing protein n=1 Tax=Nocardia uniformis TaxID=53432 RepID=A0A849C7B9_9NOCA|nr:HNH endonuclease signature motif containing protein [Nocardia uniformis]NNH72215.1 DUF222 domain-containing protein [Nocardia uniformis]
MTRGEGTRERDAVDDFVAAVDRLLEYSFTRSSDSRFIEQLRAIETGMRKLAVVQHREVVETANRSLWEAVGVKTTHRFLRETLNLSKADASARLRAARQLGRLLSATGVELPPRLPRTADAQTTGEISADHARVIMNVMDRVPADTPDDRREAAEDQLVEAARTCTPDGVRQVGHMVLGYLDPDGTLTNDADRHRRRTLTVSKQGVDGMSEATLTLDPAGRALLDVVLAKWGRPGMCNPDDPQSPAIAAESFDKKLMEAAASRDRRDAGQRNYDALMAFLRAGGPEKLGEHRGLPVTVILTMTLAEVEQAAGVATTASGGTMSVTEALRLAEGAHPLLMIFDHRGKPLHLGDGERLATKWQRLGRIAFDRGCTRPGCDAPPTMCQMHHVLGWAQNGPTDIDNLTLVCDHCHGLITGTASGWETEILGDDSPLPGRTGWRAPAHVDPAGLLRTNALHHTGELLGQAQARIQLRNARAARQLRGRRSQTV